MAYPDSREYTLPGFNESCTFLLFPGSSMQEKSEDSMPTTDTGHEPQAPITRRGFLTSFKTGKAMNIPETDVVSSVELRL